MYFKVIYYLRQESYGVINTCDVLCTESVHIVLVVHVGVQARVAGIVDMSKHKLCRSSSLRCTTASTMR